MTEPMRTTIGIARITPTSVSGFNWEAGIQFTPCRPNPVYTSGGRRYNLGQLRVWHIVSSGGNLMGECQHGYVYQGMRGTHTDLANLRIELPRGPATYLFSIQLGARQDPSNQHLNQYFHLYLTDQSNDRVEVPLTSLAGRGGFTGIHQIIPSTNSLPLPGGGTMRYVSARIDFEYQGTAVSRIHTFHGFTIMRL